MPKKSKLPWLIAFLVGLLALGSFALWWFWPDLDRRRGLELARELRPGDALPHLLRALDRRPQDVELLKALAQAERSLDLSEDAEQHLTRWCALQSRQSEPFRQRMQLRIDRRQFPEALEDGEHLLELAPDNEEVGRLVAPMLLITGQLDKAEIACRHWLKSAPNDPNLLYLAADISHQRGDNQEALKLVDRLLELQPESSRALLLKGILEEEADRPEQAIGLLEKMLKAPGSISEQMSARYYLSLALARTGRREEAQKALAEVQWYQAADLMQRREHPKVPGLMVRVAEAMLGVSQAEEAVRLLEKLPDQDPNCLPEAIRILEKAVSSEPNNADAKRLLESLRRRQEEPKPALRN